MTSRQVVNIVHRLTRPAKAGHAGTLDPLATGVLVVGVGGATRLIEYVQRMPKRYVGTFLLGRQSPTEDIEGEITELPDAPVPTCAAIEAATRRFVGRIDQRPPAFSALKLAGRPAYKLARQGKPVDLKPRPVEIYRIGVVAYQYPELVLEIECGGGTYVRSLGRDLAESLGTAAVMSALVRQSIGSFRLEDAVSPDALTNDNWPAYLHPPLRAVERLPHWQLSADQATRIRNGLTIERTGQGETPDKENATFSAPADCEEVAAVDSAGQLVGVVCPTVDGRWRTVRNLPTGT